MNKLYIFLLLCVLCLTSLIGTSYSEIIPTSGTFEGIYHRDRWGVGHFAFYYVHPDLHPQLKPYEGRFIKLLVIEANQPMNPGPAIIIKIGDITPLEYPPLQVKLRTIPQTPRASEPFQLICELVNTGDKEITVSDIHLRLTWLKNVEEPNFRDSWFSTAYTRGQLARESTGGQMFDALVSTLDGGYYGRLAPSGRIGIPPGDTFPVVLLCDKGMPSNEYEITASASGDEGGNWLKLRPENWLAVNINEQQKSPEIPTSKLRVVSKSVKPLENDIYELHAMIASEDKEIRRLAQYGFGHNALYAGRIIAFAKDGTEIPLETETEQTYYKTHGSWRMLEIPDEGADIKVPFKTTTRFAGKYIDRIILDILTDRGIESFTVAENFNDIHAVELPEFGPAVGGVRLCVRPAKSVFKKGEPLVFYFQAVNVSGKPVVWWHNTVARGRLAENAIAKIDGVPIDAERAKAEYVYGWAADHTIKTPQEWDIALPESCKPAKGKHTFQYSIKSVKGGYKNTNNKDIPLLEGELISNIVTFEIE